MEIIIDKLPGNTAFPLHLIEQYKGRQPCFFDIETTGFSRSKASIILIGMLYYEEDTTVIKQYFAEHPSEEPLILEAFLNDISKFDLFISYNGDTFDIPFINNKCQQHGITAQVDPKKSLDLLKVVKKNKKVLGLESYKLKQVEKLLGINREDQIDGRESIRLYYAFVASQNKDLQAKILKHNYDDIYYLPSVLGIYEKIHAVYTIDFSHLSEPFRNLKSAFIEDLSLNHNKLKIKVKIPSIGLGEQIYFGTSYTLKWIPSNHQLFLDIEVYEGNLSDGSSCVYLDQRDYPFDKSIANHSQYSLPQHIVIIKLNKDFILEHIKELITLLITETL